MRQIGHGVADAATIPAGCGEMGERMRVEDRSKTRLAPVAPWSPSLRMMVGFLPANGFPLPLWSGRSYLQIYRDADRPIRGGKHPTSLGRPVSQC